MEILNNLELTLAKLYKSSPQFSKNSKKIIVKYLPWISLLLSALSLWSAWLLWQWSHVEVSLVNYANHLNQLYGGGAKSLQKVSAGIWIGIAILLIETVVLLLSTSSLRNKKKLGWDLLFYLTIINVIYGVVIAFTNYGNLLSLVEELVGSIAGLYVLFQIRSSYKSPKIETGKPKNRKN